MSGSRQTSNAKSEINLLQEMYNTACDNNHFDLMLEIANKHHQSICLNPILRGDRNDSTTFPMSLAAVMIMNNNPLALNALRIISDLPGFNFHTNEKNSDGTRPADILHAAISSHHPDLVEKTLSSLRKSLSEAEIAEYLNCPVMAQYPVIITPMALAFSTKTEYSKEIAEQLYSAGADPYTFIISARTGVRMSLLSALKSDTLGLNDYIEILRRNPQKLLAFLKTRSTNNRIIYPYIMDKIFESVQSALHEELRTNRQLASLGQFPSKDKFLAKASPKFLLVIEKARRVRLLHQETCFDLTKNTKSSKKRDWIFDFREASKAYVEEFKIFYDDFLPSIELVFTHCSSENDSYLGIVSDDNDEVHVPIVDSLAGMTAPYIYAMDKNYRACAMNKSVAVPHPYNNRKENQPFFGSARGQTPITLATLANSIEYIKDAISVDHPDLNEPVVFGPFDGLTPIIIAIFKKHGEILELLLNHFFHTKKFGSKFANEPLGGAFAGLTLQAAMAHADRNNKDLFKRLIAGKGASNMPAAAATPTQPVAATKAKRKATHKPLNDLTTAEVASITASSSSSSTRSTATQEANCAVQVFESFLKQMRQDARDKVNLLNGLVADEKSALDNVFAEIEAITAISGIEGDEDPDVKLAECQKATDELTKIINRFNGIYKKCERLLTKKPSYIAVAVSDDNDEDSIEVDDNDAVEAPAAEVKKPTAQPAEACPYDIHRTDYVVLNPSKPMHTENAKKPPQKPMIPQSSSLFGQKRALPINAHARSLLSDCKNKIDQLKKSYESYQAYCVRNNNNGLFDVDSAMAVSAMSAEVLATYETLLKIQRDHSAFGVFCNAKSAAAWRDMSKYAYVYIFSHEAGYFTTLMEATLGLVADTVNNRLLGKEVRAIEKDQRPAALVSAYQAGGNIANKAILTSRYKNILALIESLNARAQKSDSTSGMHQDSVRAKLFCLSLLCQVIKDGGAPNEISYQHDYSEGLRNKVLLHPAGENFESDSKTEKATPLLNFFTAAIKINNGIEKVKAIISELTAGDMAVLLREILNTISHKFDSEWVMLANPRIREMSDHIAKQCQRVFSPTYADRATDILNSLKTDETINQQARLHPFFIALETALKNIANNNAPEALNAKKALLASHGMPDRFNGFANNFKITNQAKAALENARQLYSDVVTSFAKQQEVHAESSTSIRSRQI